MRRVKWSSAERRWVEDPGGVTIVEARARGGDYTTLPRHGRLFVIEGDEAIPPDEPLTSAEAAEMAAIVAQLVQLTDERRSVRAARRERRMALSRARSKRWYADRDAC
jgi:hypothetical protein